MKRFIITLSIIFIMIIIGVPIYIECTPNGIIACNSYESNLKKADDKSNYDKLKKVENTCRAMISSYESDKMVYEQYKNSDNEEKLSWGEQAKMRANKTASTYNNYILKNEYLWKDNVPEDIKEKLEIIE